MAIFSTAAILTAQEAKMKLSSPDFENNAFIPKEYSYNGRNINPTLIIENIPKQAKTLALIVDDPDAPRGDWVHWVVYNIPIIYTIEENSIPGTQGRTDFGTNRYGGPCPPFGTHRYFFKIYALDTELDLSEDTAKAQLEQAMQGHILDKAELIGLYEKE
jgi:Raf kinase inhibitor-like YbhB/YbcL family protein